MMSERVCVHGVPMGPVCEDCRAESRADHEREKSIRDALEDSTKWLISERDSLYECITDSEGNIPPGEEGEADAAYLKQLDELIDRNRALLSGINNGGDDDDSTI